LKLKQGYVNSSKDEEQRYRKILKEWFADEKRFIDEVTPIVKALPPQPISVNESRTKKVIFETITNIDKQGWQYAFVSEQDYNLFTDLLTNFFEYKPYTLPETIIQLKRTCKTKIAKALGEIHKELSNENKLSTDTNTEKFSLWNLLKNFDKDSIHYSAMNMIAVVGINLDKLLIFTVIGSKELAIFFFAQAIPLQARGMLRIIHNLTFPKFIDKEINFYKVNRSILGLLLFGLLGVVSYILVAPVLFSLLFPQYLSSVYLTQLYSLSIIVYPAIYLMSGILLAKNTTLYLYKISIYNTIGNAMLLLVAANISSLQGVVYAVIASSILYFTLFYYYFYKTSTTS
jgi:hypothetical protein